ncbi:probable protein phosphatase 2C 46 [Salvia hispanica]|uniref:probable protein phosphatase 2C 46 n=1 Tax=Salvia hispanica TaxID=49212 RepID=UPI0020094ED6|nr:probable protein phosphatase 2C 46 [Salvia hispanica]
MAAVKSDVEVQSHSQVESGSMRYHPSSPYGTFVGIYDGHGGPDASEFIKNHLFKIVKRLTSDIGEMSSDVLDLSFLAVEEGYSHLVQNESVVFPNLLSGGSSCLVGVVIEGRVYVANVGDSRAVLAQLPRPKPPVQVVREKVAELKLKAKQRLDYMNEPVPRTLVRPPRPHSPPMEPKSIDPSYLDVNPYRRPMLNRDIKAIPLSTDHNVDLPSIRQELKALHPHIRRIVPYDYEKNIYRVKGILRTSRSIGDVYLKSWEYNTRPDLPKEYKVDKKFDKPIILCNPALAEQELLPEDKFIIFASHGLWKYVADEEAVDMVLNSSRKGIAKKLVKKALRRWAMHAHKLTYRELKKLDIAKRRLLHDDISVVVLFLDQELMDGGRCNHLSLNAYGASTSQPDKGKGKASTSKQHADGDSSSNTDRARSRILPLIGEASTSQTPTAITKSKTWPGFSRRRHET